MFRRSPLAAAVVAIASCSSAFARSEEGTIQAAHDVLKEFLDLRLKDIPEAMLSEAHGVAIIPNLIKVGLVVGGQHGKGVIVIREKNGSWRGPMFLSLTGGSLGWQAGAQSTDIVLVFKSQRSIEGMMKGKFTLGADAAVAAGPVGRRAGAATDAELKAEIYSYSRSRGLFAGVSLDGSVLQLDDAANAAYYGQAPGSPPRPVPQSALKLVETIAVLTAHPGAAVAGAAPTPATLPATPLGPALADPQARPIAETDALRAELATAATSLSALLDPSWQRYLALPAEIFQSGRQPAPEAMAAAVARFDAVAQGPAYRALAQRAEFQTVHGLFKAYYEATTAAGTSRLVLPPPPGAR